jgi:hypothetical protein
MPFPYTQQTWTDGVSSASAARLTVIEAGIALAGVFGTGSSPPGSPSDGMIWRLPAASGSGVYWFLQYDSSQATYKWVSMGGPPMSSQSDTDGTWNSTTYVDPTTTPNATVTVPRAGDYEVSWGFQAGIATSDFEMRSAVKIGAAASSDDNCCSAVSPSASGRLLTGHRQKVITAAASDVLKLQYRSSAAGGVTLFSHWLHVRPVRVI